MRAAETYDYAVVRVVPRVEREEFINVGVVLSCPAFRFLEARIELDEARLLALDPGVDVELIRRHLASFPAICAGTPDSDPIGQLPQRARFHWLTARRSSIIQTSPVHTGRCTDPSATIERLMARMVRPVPRRPAPRRPVPRQATPPARGQ
ncbi:MAG TPA: DUF3037 domain-containing protein [Burkholderiaceae bacterium]|nr:DUF3037 domain-containing protein [Burkholderiaceae bacterium]